MIGEETGQKRVLVNLRMAFRMSVHPISILLNFTHAKGISVAEQRGYVELRMIHSKALAVLTLLVIVLSTRLLAEQIPTSTDDAIRELVGRGAIIKRFEARDAETVGLLVRLKAIHLDAMGRVDPAVIDQLVKIPDLALELRSLPLSDEGLKLLFNRINPIGLDLSGSDVTNRGFAAVTRAERLRWLDVSFTKIDDDGLKPLSKLKDLRHVSIIKCPVSDEGLRHLESLGSLREVYLSDTRVSDHSITRLRHRLPKCNIER